MTVTSDKQKLFLDYYSEVESICRPLFDFLPITFSDTLSLSKITRK